MKSISQKQPSAPIDPSTNAERNARGMHLAVASLAALYLFVVQAWPRSFPEIVVKTSWPVTITIISLSTLALAAFLIMRSPRFARKP
jgi:hypothetical protein